MFADIRGSTGLAEQLPPSEFGQLLTRFWGTAARVVDRWDGIVDKFVGDEAVALFIPGFAGEDHAARAVKAARELLIETGHGEGEAWVPVGIGVHTGLSYVGYIGEGDALDFTALGDTVNTAARLTSMAKGAAAAEPGRREGAVMRACDHRERGAKADQHARNEFHDTIPMLPSLSSGRGWASTIDANPGDRGLPGFCPSVHPGALRRAAALGPAPRLRGAGTLAANSPLAQQAACQPES